MHNVEILQILLRNDLAFVTCDATCECRYPGSGICNHKIEWHLWMTNIHEETVECFIWENEEIAKAHYEYLVEKVKEWKVRK